MRLWELNGYEINCSQLFHHNQIIINDILKCLMQSLFFQEDLTLSLALTVLLYLTGMQCFNKFAKLYFKFKKRFRWKKVCI